MPGEKLTEVQKAKIRKSINETGKPPRYPAGSEGAKYSASYMSSRNPNELRAARNTTAEANRGTVKETPGGKRGYEKMGEKTQENQEAAKSAQRKANQESIDARKEDDKKRGITRNSGGHQHVPGGWDTINKIKKFQKSKQ